MKNRKGVMVFDPNDTEEVTNEMFWEYLVDVVVDKVDEEETPHGGE